MKVILRTYLMKVIPGTYLMKVRETCNIEDEEKQNKNTMQYVLDITICKQTQITYTRHEPSYKQTQITYTRHEPSYKQTQITYTRHAEFR
jgi:hypothetical protein